ncbi:hypothetical protein, partial [Neglectibacter timonensis]|uniref:hypothetical protein n=1 Tax=Neglectibacter timonensis TaxID=1776382 RepID=UPI00248E5124
SPGCQHVKTVRNIYSNIVTKNPAKEQESATTGKSIHLLLTMIIPGSRFLYRTEACCKILHFATGHAGWYLYFLVQRVILFFRDCLGHFCLRTLPP